jgi:hypothetical protein
MGGAAPREKSDARPIGDERREKTYTGREHDLRSAGRDKRRSE